MELYEGRRTRPTRFTTPRCATASRSRSRPSSTTRRSPAGVYEIFRQTKKGERFLIDLLLECGKTEVSPGVSLLRTVYEDGVRES